MSRLPTGHHGHYRKGPTMKKPHLVSVRGRPQPGVGGEHDGRVDDPDAGRGVACFL